MDEPKEFRKEKWKLKSGVVIIVVVGVFLVVSMTISFFPASSSSSSPPNNAENSSGDAVREDDIELDSRSMESSPSKNRQSSSSTKARSMTAFDETPLTSLTSFRKSSASASASKFLRKNVARKRKAVDNHGQTGIRVKKIPLAEGQECRDHLGRIRGHLDTYPFGPGTCGTKTCYVSGSSRWRASTRIHPVNAASNAPSSGENFGRYATRATRTSRMEIARLCGVINDWDVPDPKNCRIVDENGDRVFPECCPYVSCKENVLVPSTRAPGACVNAASDVSCAIWKKNNQCDRYGTWCAKTCGTC